MCPRRADPAATGPVDVLGAALVTVALVGLAGGLIEAPDDGWASPQVLALLAVAVAGFVAFVVAQQRERFPMLPLTIFRSRQFSATNVVTFVVYAAIGGALFLLPVDLQQVSHYSPFEAGSSLLPLTAVMLALSARSGALAVRLGPRLQMSVGPVVVGAGMVLLRLVGPSGNYLTEVLPGVLVLAVGLVITVAPLTATALSSAPVEQAGMASAVNNDVARAGGLIAVALLPALAGLTGRSYVHAAAFSSGFERAVLYAGVAAAVGGVLAALLVRNPVGSRRLWSRGPGPASTEAGMGVCCPLEATPLGHATRKPVGSNL